MEKRIIRNRILCKLCGTFLESKHRHDFVSCKCGTFVDGGLDYVRCGAADLDNIKFLTEYEELPLPRVSHLGLLLDLKDEPKILGGELSE